MGKMVRSFLVLVIFTGHFGDHAHYKGISTFIIYAILQTRTPTVRVPGTSVRIHISLTLNRLDQLPIYKHLNAIKNLQASMSKTSNLYLQMQKENDELKQTVVDLKKKIDLQQKEIAGHHAMADAVRNFCLTAIEAQGKGWSVWLKGPSNSLKLGWKQIKYSMKSMLHMNKKLSSAHLPKAQGSKPDEANEAGEAKKQSTINLVDGAANEQA